jgi:internalin A
LYSGFEVRGTQSLDGLTIARERIAQEASEKTGFLDLGRLGLKALPVELFQLKHLRRLNLGLGYVDENGQWQESVSNLGPNAVAGEVRQLAELKELRHSSLKGIELSDLGPLQGLTNLQGLDCWLTQVSDLAPLHGFTNLQTLNCLSTRVSGLGPLQGLTSLRQLNCSRTQVRDLSGLQGLTNLQQLDCSWTPCQRHRFRLETIAQKATY